MPPSCPTWTAPLRETDPEAPPVRIWRLCLNDLGGASTDILWDLTVPSEHARAQRYRFADDRRRHLAGRALVRMFMARQHGIAPTDLSIREGPHGKPRLAEDRDDGIPHTFNVAHTESVVVAAFSRTAPVGIDVEALDRDADTEPLAQRIFSDAEQRRWRALPQEARPQFFFRVWTCKEAFLKATGRGLRRSPCTIECIFDGDSVAGLRDADEYQPSSSDRAAADWDVHPFSVSDRIAGAVVRKRPLPSTVAFADAGDLASRIARQ